MDDSLGISSIVQKAPALAQDLLQKVQQNLTCSVCQELMFLPYLLQCGHCVCYDCIESWLAKRETGTCPMCRHAVESRPILSVGMKDMVEDLTTAIAAADANLSAKLSRLKNEQMKHRQDDLRIHGREFPKFVSANSAFLEADEDGERIRRCSRCLWEVSGPVCDHCGARVMGYDDFAEEEEEDGEDLMVGYDQTMETVESMDSEDERFLDDRPLDEISVHSEDDSDLETDRRRQRNTNSDPIVVDDSSDEDVGGPSRVRARGGQEVISLDDDDDDDNEFVTEPRRRRIVTASDDEDADNDPDSPFEMVTEPARASSSHTTSSRGRTRVIEDEEEDSEEDSDGDESELIVQEDDVTFDESLPDVEADNGSEEEEEEEQEGYDVEDIDHESEEEDQDQDQDQYSDVYDSVEADDQEDDGYDDYDDDDNLY